MKYSRTVLHSGTFMMKLQVTLSIAVVFVLALVAHHGLAEPIPEIADLRPRVETEVDGIALSIPVYEEDYVASAARREFDCDMLDGIFRRLRKTLHLVVVEKRNHFTVANSAKGLVPYAWSRSKELKKLIKAEATPDFSESYPVKMHAMLIELLTKDSGVKISDEEVMRRLEVIFEGLSKICLKSPVGLYLDWPKLSIGGETLLENTSPIIRWFRENGYSAELKLFTAVANVMKSMNR